jgi:hypothetical protein
LEAWRLGGLEAWRLGGLEAWRLGGFPVFAKGDDDAFNFAMTITDGVLRSTLQSL